MQTRYPLDQSPLYRLRARRKIAELLKLPLRSVEELANADPPRYKCFDRVMIRSDGSEKKRKIEWPFRELQHVQRRLAQLLDRIEAPPYIHSGFRGRSYITNAREHCCTARLAKIDIRSFFPSSSARYVFKCFQETFQCSPDAAAVLTKLTTIAEHLPTGGSTSSILSYYAYKPMFDEIQTLALSCGLVMTCCVDDMTFSGKAATSGFLNRVRMIVSRYGLKTHKRHCFEPMRAKVVTGIALTPQGVRIPNRRRKKLHEAFLAFEREANPCRKVKRGEEVLGRVVEAAQVEQRFRAIIPAATQNLNEAKRALRRFQKHQSYHAIRGSLREIGSLPKLPWPAMHPGTPELK